MKNIIVLFLIVIAFCQVCYADDLDVLYLKYGSIIKGRIIEQIMGSSVKIETADGSIYLYQADEIDRIEKAANAGNTSFSVVTASVYKNPNTAFMFSFVPPILLPIQGLGQMYVGKTSDGIGYLAVGIWSAIEMYNGFQKEITYGYEDGVYYEEETYVNEKRATLFAALYIGSWLLSSFEAKSEAEKINSGLSVTDNGTPILGRSYSF